MANPSLSYSALSINEQAESLSACLAKAEALTEIALSQETLHWQRPSVIYHYLWALCGFIEQAKYLCDEVITELLKLVNASANAQPSNPGDRTN